MNADHEKAMFENFPDIFPGGRNVDVRENLMVFGFDCGDGWEPIIRKLCLDIQKILDADPSLKQHFRAVQVKEKYGSLRFYVEGGNTAIYDAIERAERKSERTCELCGLRGRMRESHGWYRTLCSVHAKEAK